jgi:glycosyltransferase involved in cell wall biosynthesis
MRKSDRYIRISVLAYVPLWFEYLCEKGGGGWLRFKKIRELAPKANINYHLVKFKLELQHPLILGVSLMFASMIKGLFQSVNAIKQKNIQLILSPVEIPQAIILAYLSSKITRRRFVVFLNSVPCYGLVSVSTFEGKTKKTSYKVLFKAMKATGLSLVNAVLETPLWYLAFRMLRSSTTNIICLSPAIANELSELNIKGRIIPIYPGNGIDYNGTPLVTFKANENRCDAIYAAGNFHPQKGIFEVVKIWGGVVKRRPEAKLAIAGVVHYKCPFVIDELNGLIRDLGLHRNVSIICDPFKGMTQKELWREMNRSKMFLYPSRKDVWPLIIGEALACGLPVMTYDLPGIEHAYGDCLAVHLVEVGDVERAAETAIRLLSDESLLKDLSRKARQYAKNHDWNHVVKLERKAYLTILKN